MDLVSFFDYSYFHSLAFFLLLLLALLRLFLRLLSLCFFALHHLLFSLNGLIMFDLGNLLLRSWLVSLSLLLLCLSILSYLLSLTDRGAEIVKVLYYLLARKIFEQLSFVVSQEFGSGLF